MKCRKFSYLLRFIWTKAVDKTIGIIGAGPAGSMLALKIAPFVKKVLIFDHKAPWEKPCGGMLGPDTFDKHPELKEYPYPIRFCNGIQYISPSNEKKFIIADKAIPVISRKEFNKFLLERAVDAGTRHIKKKVLNVSKEYSEWRIETTDRSYDVDIIIGADGVNSKVRNVTAGKYPSVHLALTCGYIITGLPEYLYITKFLDIEGYLWIISRYDHASVGIGAKLSSTSGKALFNILDKFLSENYKQYKIKSRFSALIPTATDPKFYDFPCCGETWILIGDAAGHVHPAVGEGIYYALSSAKIAAHSILNGDIRTFDQLWQNAYGDIFKRGAAFRQTLSTFPGKFVGQMMFLRATASLT